MTRDVTLGIWLALALSWPANAFVGRATGGKQAGFGEFLRRVTRRLVPGVVIFVCWMWVGWHFFAR